MDTVVSKIRKNNIPSWPARNASPARQPNGSHGGGRSDAGGQSGLPAVLRNTALQAGMQLFLRLSAWIGAPVLMAVAVGKYLDAKYRTDPWLFLFSVGIAFVVSTWAIIHYGLKEMKRIEREFPPKGPLIDKQEDTSWKNNHQQ